MYVCMYNAGGKPTRDFSLQNKTFSALKYTQDFGTTVKKSLKRTRKNSKWTTLTKSRIVPCQILSCLCQQSQLCLSHRCKQRQKKIRDWIEGTFDLIDNEV